MKTKIHISGKRQFAATGLGRGFQAGAEQVRQLNADAERFQVVERLFDQLTRGKAFPDREAEFLCTTIAEMNEACPKFSEADAAYVDLLKRKYC